MTTHAGDESRNSVHAPDKHTEPGSRRGECSGFHLTNPLIVLCFYLFVPVAV